MSVKLKWLNSLLVIVFLICLSAVFSILNNLNMDSELEAENLITALASELELAINEQFVLLDAVVAFTITNHSDINFEDKFYEFSNLIFKNDKTIKNISLAPNGIQQYVVPLEGNESVIGHDLINDERDNVRSDVERAMLTNQTVISGPYVLRQGGFGLIARKAVYIKDQFWGIVVIVIDFDQLILNSSLTGINTNFKISIKDKDQLLIYGEQSHKIIRERNIALPEGYITMTINESEDSLKDLRKKEFQWWLFLFIISILLCFISYQEYKNLTEFEKKIGIRSDEINTLNKNLESSKMIALHSLIQGLGHNINTPLGSSLMTLTYLEKEFLKLKNNLRENKDFTNNHLIDNISEAIDISEEGLESAISVVTSFSESFGSTSKNEYIFFNLNEELSAIRNSMILKNNSKKIKLVINCSNEISLYNNPKLILNVINLMLENSINHGFKNLDIGEVTINVMYANDFIELKYSDNGQGVAKEYLSKLFNPFYTSDLAHFNGLGLYTIYTLVSQQLGGTINATCVPGEGLVFEIKIPSVFVNSNDMEYI